ncbi:GNAT family protein [Mesorhizobium sp.]|uniref:GNAT family N-acetyltransferase n=1 Tax=Mesorhizobium sp. TaxID=1871066 RepID=UPI00122A6D1F|nr:GNAT family protein [Mesorhizobium sp.]TIP18385.1 MAG: GNAT family N-acetyltransferase [Mesorhizobium sp.]
MNLQTKRLVLRKWNPEDLEPLARINDDPRVVRYVAKLVDRGALAAWIAGQREHFKRHGHGLWALELSGAAKLIGFCGLVKVPYQAHFTPAVDIAWRLAPAHWGRGYATEAASAALAFGFGRLRLNEIVANAAVANLNSRRVMERLGMTHDPQDDFDHPLMAGDDPLQRQVLYRIKAENWAQLKASSTGGDST